ncbi:MAG TPA: LysM peptidoglycan-binding domain-containing protein [Chthoniobacterales bacterium]
MKTVIKVLVVLVLFVAVFGGAAWFAYDLYLKPRAIILKKNLPTPTPVPTPEPSTVQWEKLHSTFKTASVSEKRMLLQKFMASYSDSPKFADARTELGQINADDFLSPSPGPNKIEYVVQRGDSIARIASHHKVSYDTLIRANNLDRLLIHPGDRFIIPTGDFSGEISPKAGVFTLLNAGIFFKDYKILAANIPKRLPGGGKLTVTDKVAWYNGSPVAFGHKNYLGSTRWISCGAQFTIYSVIEKHAGAPPDVNKPFAGIQLSPEDVEELFALVNRGTPITIVP